MYPPRVISEKFCTKNVHKWFCERLLGKIKLYTCLFSLSTLNISAILLPYLLVGRYVHTTHTHKSHVLPSTLQNNIHTTASDRRATNRGKNRCMDLQSFHITYHQSLFIRLMSRDHCSCHVRLASCTCQFDREFG